MKSKMIFLSLYVVVALGCAADTGAEGQDGLGPSGAAGKADGSGQSANEPVATVIRPGILTEEDSGRTVDCTPGQPVQILLGSNLTTGFKWVLLSAGGLGTPIEGYYSDADTLGGGGQQMFLFQTNAATPLGEHKIELAYKRDWGNAEPAKTVSITVAMRSPSESNLVVLDLHNRGGTVPVSSGKELVIQLYSNPSSGYSWRVTSHTDSLGSPRETFERTSDDSPAGMQVFTWDTNGAEKLGSHAIALAHTNAAGSGTATFAVTVNIEPAMPSD